MVSAVVDRGNGGPWEWRTPGMADLNPSGLLPALIVGLRSVICITSIRL